ncbi:hypothetical protein EJ07DRAFT_156031 [Lizonia empirigonia]|nr:hypothetical protein EJ07DRAFT_156031 [Lizonia empirigonia]
MANSEAGNSFPSRDDHRERRRTRSHRPSNPIGEASAATVAPVSADTQCSTQQTLQGSQQDASVYKRHLIRESKRHRSTFLEASTTPTDPTDESAPNREEPTIPKPDYYSIDVGPDDDVTRIEALVHTHKIAVRVTYSSSNWQELEQDSNNEDDYVIRIGHDSTVGTPHRHEISPELEIRDPAEYCSSVNDFPVYFHQSVTVMLVAIRDLALQAENVVTYNNQLHDEQLASKDRLLAEKTNRILNLENQIQALRAKGKAIDVTQSDAYVSLANERNELKARAEGYTTTIAQLQHEAHESRKDRDDYASLTKDYEHERSEADKFYKLYTDEKAKANRYYIERENAAVDHDDLRKEVDDLRTRVATADSRNDDLENRLARNGDSLLAAQQEASSLLAKLRRYEPSYQPYTVHRRDRTDPSRDPVDERRRTFSPRRNRSPATSRIDYDRPRTRSPVGGRTRDPLRHEDRQRTASPLGNRYPHRHDEPQDLPRRTNRDRHERQPEST